MKFSITGLEKITKNHSTYETFKVEIFSTRATSCKFSENVT